MTLAETDSTGHATFAAAPRLPEGFTSVLTVIADGFRPLTATLPSGSEDGMELRLERLGVLQEVSGVVRLPDGSPVEGILVTCKDVRATTDEHGAYRLASITGLRADHVFLYAEGDGYARARVSVPVPGEAGREVDVIVEPVVPIRGVVRDQDGSLLEGVTVSVRRTLPTSFHATTITGPDGKFEVESAPGGTYELGARGPKPNGEYRLDAKVTFHTDRVARGPIEVVLTRLGAAPGSLTARTSLGEDVAGARIERNSDGTRSVPAPERISIESGIVSATGIHLGEWRLWLLAHDGRIGYRDFSITDARSHVDLSVSIGEPGSITGIVRSGEAPLTTGNLRVHAVMDPCRRPPFTEAELGRVFACRAKALVQEDMTFALPGLLEGHYLVRVVGAEVTGSQTAEVMAGEECAMTVLVSRSD